MSKLRSAAILAAGIAGIAYGRCEYNNQFSNSEIWKRQRPAMERIRGEERQDAFYKRLRMGLEVYKDSSRKERCMFEKRFELIMQKGSDEAADKEIKRRSYEPFEECNAYPQLKKEIKTWHGVAFLAGVAAFFAGLGGFFMELGHWRLRRAAKKRELARMEQNQYPFGPGHPPIMQDFDEEDPYE